MSLPLVLFALRLLGAVLLLAFLALIAWFLVRDFRLARAGSAGDLSAAAALRVVESESAALIPDTAFPLAARNTIGRGKRNTIVLDEAYVSAEHAEIWRHDERWWLRDVGSRNGTLLNDSAVSGDTLLADGDVLTVGSVVFRVELGRQPD